MEKPEDATIELGVEDGGVCSISDVPTRVWS